MKFVLLEGVDQEQIAEADLNWWGEMAPHERLLAMESCRLDEARMRGRDDGNVVSFQDSYRDLFIELNRAEVRYLVVGGYAVGFHARPRYTKDIDILVEPTLENAERFLEALNRFIGDTGLAADRFARPDVIFMVGNVPYRIDFLTSIPGVEFSDSWERRANGEYAGEPVIFLSLPDLIASKKAAARPQDLIDVEVLERRLKLDR